MTERGGVVGVARRVFKHEWLAGEPYTRVQAWLWIVAEAAWKPRRSRVAGMWVSLDRAQLAHSLSYMARTWQWSVKRVRTFLARLQEDHMIAVRLQKGTAKGTGLTVISVCNYDEYQITPLPKGTGRGTAGAQQGHEPEEGLIDERQARPRNFSKIVSPEAIELADEFLNAIGADPKAPERYGMEAAPYVMQLWLTRGYERLIILATAVEKSARYGGNKPLTWWTKAMDSAHRERPVPSQRKLPLLQTIEPTGGQPNVVAPRFDRGRSPRNNQDTLVAGMARALAERPDSRLGGRGNERGVQDAPAGDAYPGEARPFGRAAGGD